MNAMLSLCGHLWLRVSFPLLIIDRYQRVLCREGKYNLSSTVYCAFYFFN